jgi:hypothetical protein
MRYKHLKDYDPGIEVVERGSARTGCYDEKQQLNEEFDTAIVPTPQALAAARGIQWISRTAT